MSTFSIETDPFENESYREFCEFWLSQQNQYLKDLISAAESQKKDIASCSSLKQEHDDDNVDALIDMVVRHYEHYYKVKSSWLELDAFPILRPAWRSSLEDAFLWLGGWRPSTAFHMLYSKSGMQLEAQLPEILHGLRTGDLGDLSPKQVLKIDALKRRTIKEEKETTEKMAKHQETIASPSMVDLSHVATKWIMEGEREGEPNGSMMRERLKLTLERKEEGLKEMVQMADELRLKTFKEILQILTKTQTIHFLIAAAELHLRVHEWGMQRDSMKHQKEEHEES
ncbi:protein DOG1-like 3 [Momordica charantia]|uniref:Protein DOG1-like 3 n=1 Tax=Momordica charantia TaxID=3673 RepID=A0A6J1DW34_MOMCH|nr:protein DOG1-like 3 [Momordica charantia]